MRWLKSTVEGAGLARYGAVTVGLICFTIAALAGAVTFFMFKIVALAFFISLGIFAFTLEALALGANSRRKQLVRLWPEVVDSIHSAVVSGLSLVDAVDELSLTGPTRLRPSFMRLSKRLDLGWSFESAIDELKAEFGEVHADRLCEVLRLVSRLGSAALASALRQQSENLRRDLAATGQIEAKQSWVTGTAKMAVAAPWLVVGMLSTRVENAAVYNTASGSAVLFAGFVVSFFAYRLVNFLGALPQSPRVYLS